MGLPGVGEWALILGALVLLFGGKKIPELGGAIGQGIRNFKKGLKDENETTPKITSTSENSDKPA